VWSTHFISTVSHPCQSDEAESENQAHYHHDYDVGSEAVFIEGPSGWM